MISHENPKILLCTIRTMYIYDGIIRFDYVRPVMNQPKHDMNSSIIVVCQELMIGMPKT